MSSKRSNYRQTRRRQGFFHNLLFCRMMRRLEKGTLSKAISAKCNFLVDMVYRATVAFIAFPFVLPIDLAKRMFHSKVGGKLFSLAFDMAVLAGFFGIWIMGAKFVEKSILFFQSVDKALGAGTSMLMLLIAFCVEFVFIGAKMLQQTEEIEEVGTADVGVAVSEASNINTKGSEEIYDSPERRIKVTKCA